MAFPSIKRVEDVPLLRGEETFIHDLSFPEMLHVRFLRSPHAHAKIKRIQSSGNRFRGVREILFARDLNPLLGPLPLLGRIPPTLKGFDLFQKDTPLHPLAEEETVYVGQPYGLILAEDAYRAEDAAEGIRTDYEPLPAVVTLEEAIRGDRLVYADWQDNFAAGVTLSRGEALQALREADVVLTEVYTTNRCCSSPMETRGVVARWRSELGVLEVWVSSQMPHFVRDVLAKLLSLPPDKVIVRVPNLGGAFGAKGGIYPEDLIIPWLAHHFRRPVAWFEDRLEHFSATAHAREQRHRITLGADGSGRFIALHDEFFIDGGAFNPTGIILPFNTACHLGGPYRYPHFLAEGRYVLTHKTPVLPYRGAGRPEAVFATERLIDRMARKLGMDPADLREKNFIEDADEPYLPGIPYRDGHPLAIDSRRFQAFMAKLRETVRYEELREEQRKLRRVSRAVKLGIGMAACIEGTAIGPFEAVRMHVDPQGIVTVRLGASSHGQGHRTILAQVCAAALQIEVEQIRVVTGDTGQAPDGIGTFASRIAVLAGNAVWRAAADLVQRCKEAGAELLEVERDEIVYEAGRVFPAGAPGRSLSLAQLVRSGWSLDVSGKFSPETVTFGGGLHAAVVEVDPDNMRVSILRYVIVHDGGNVINPAIVEGQLHGGVAQGIGEALFEHIRYDRSGQLQTQTFMDYLLPTSCDVPSMEIHHVSTPSRLNPLGLKGVGEAGAICPPAAIANAIEDALGGDLHIDSIPIRTIKPKIW